MEVQVGSGTITKLASDWLPGGYPATLAVVKLTMARIGGTPAPAAGKRRWISDDGCPGLVVRVTGSGHKSWWYRYSADGRRRAIRLGVFPTLTLEAARDAAAKHARAVADGSDPAAVRKANRAAPTMVDLWKRYWTDHARPHKRSANDDLARWRLHVEPVFGRMRVEEVTHSDVTRLHKKIGATSPGAANRVASLLSKMFALGERWGLRSAPNPARGVQRYAERKVERCLDDDEYARVLTELGRETVPAVVRDAIELAIYTGMRIGKVLERTQGDVDRQRQALRLVETDQRPGRPKPVPTMLALNPEAWAVVSRRIDRDALPGAPLFPDPSSPADPLSYPAVDHRWRRIRVLAGVSDLRIHDLRHSFASMGAAAGMSLPEIGALLGHRSPATTARYTHLADAVQRKNTTTIGARIAAASKASSVVVPMSPSPHGPRPKASRSRARSR